MIFRRQFILNCFSLFVVLNYLIQGYLYRDLQECLLAEHSANDPLIQILSAYSIALAEYESLRYMHHYADPLDELIVPNEYLYAQGYAHAFQKIGNFDILSPLENQVVMRHWKGTPDALASKHLNVPQDSLRFIRSSAFRKLTEQTLMLNSWAELLK